MKPEKSVLETSGKVNVPLTFIIVFCRETYREHM